MEPKVAYLADGKLFLHDGGAAAREVESRYAQEMVEDLQRARQKNEWKTRSQTGRMMAGGMPWAVDTSDPSARNFRIVGVAPGEEAGSLLYALDIGTVSGLFRYEVAEDAEHRLFHNNRFHIRHLAPHPDGRQVAFSNANDDGTASIALIPLNGNGLQVLTEGDSQDEAPAWVPGGGNRLVFQSAGIGRNQEGHFAGLGPTAIQLFDLDREDLETLLEDPKKDFLLPRMTADGTLYCIRRPYQPHRMPGAGHLIKDLMLLPVRIVFALFGFLNFFSQVFAGKPLMTAGGPKKEGADPRYVMLWGKMVDAERAERATRKGEPAALVPKDWELIARTTDGTERVLAESVVSYDLCPDGGVVYTDGSTIYRLSPKGEKERLGGGKRIEHVMLIDRY